jgi:beta-galactosidase
MRLRCSNKPYLDAVERYFDELLKRLAPLYCGKGGPIAAIQIENGYASCGNDLAYMKILKGFVVRTDFDGILFTADGDSDTRIATESIEGVWKTQMLGESPLKGIEILNAQQAPLPPMISEFWGGQGFRTGTPRRLRDLKTVANDLDKTLAAGAHVNVYMFHGGTNFGFMNGGLSHLRGYEPFITSYDVDAPLNEAGDPTPKYFAFREVVAKYNEEFDKSAAVPPPTRKKAYGEVALTEKAPLIPCVGKLASARIESPTTLTMEEIGQSYGFILYRAKLRHQGFPLPVRVVEPRDRAWLFLDGRRVAAFGRNDASHTVALSIPKEGATLDILVENMGRHNFHWDLEENRKGITCGVVLNNQQFQHGWEIFGLPLNDLAKAPYGKLDSDLGGPAFFKGAFEVEERADTFLRFAAGKRGVCWINGFNLGRYDNQGPQFALYVPAPLLKQGRNVVEILELEQLSTPYVELIDHPEL